MHITEFFHTENGCIEFTVYPKEDGFEYPFEMKIHGDSIELSEKELNELIRKLRWLKKAHKTVI